MLFRYTSLAALLVSLFLLAPTVLAQSDLTVTSAVAETSNGEPGDRVTLDYTVANVGNATSPETEVGFYFSSDDTISSDDAFSEMEGIQSLSPGESEGDNEQISIPSNAPRGAGFLIVFVDNIEFVTELDETNNTVAIPFTVNGAVSSDAAADAPSLALAGAFPNPVRSRTTVRFALPAAGDAHLTVTDALGRRVATLVEGVRPAGAQSVVWDARSARLAAGVYTLRLDAGGDAVTRRLVVVL